MTRGKCINILKLKIKALLLLSSSFLLLLNRTYKFRRHFFF